jgi:hypothetical protein
MSMPPTTTFSALCLVWADLRIPTNHLVIGSTQYIFILYMSE